MTAATLATVPSLDLGRLTARAGAVWALAAAPVLSMHVAVAFALHWRRPRGGAGGAPPARRVELAPVPMASSIAAQGDMVEAEPSELASAARTAETLDEVEPDVAAETIELPLAAAEPRHVVDAVSAETLAAEDAPATSPMAPVEPVRRSALASVEEVVPDAIERESAAETEETIPDVVEAVTPEVDVPLPQPRPKTETVAEVKADKRVA